MICSVHPKIQWAEQCDQKYNKSGVRPADFGAKEAGGMIKAAVFDSY